MKVLVVGGGGREHALAWALARSPQHPHLYIAPGNAGTAALGTNVPIRADDVDGLLNFATREGIGLTVVGPEQPLVMGIVDRFEAEGLRVVGPTAAAARLEGSKAFSKAFMARHGIPTAGYRTFETDDYDAARAYLDAHGAPVVIKASGLAGGKGAIVCAALGEAREALDVILKERRFGQAGEAVVIEDFMQGEEASVFVLADGEDYALLATAQDHKRIGEGDTGPNTGGMGAYAPAPVVTEALMARIRDEVVVPTLAGMAEEGYPYRGVLYVGLMLTTEGPKVVEYNCRLGDPEAQVVLPLLDADLVDVFVHLAEGRLADVDLAQRPGAAACVVMASGGYPEAYDKGHAIHGLEAAGAHEGVTVLHAGTKQGPDGVVVTAGGRVLGVTAHGGDLGEALDRAYAAVADIRFEGAQHRRDIGHRGLARMSR